MDGCSSNLKEASPGNSARRGIVWLCLKKILYRRVSSFLCSKNSKTKYINNIRLVVETAARGFGLHKIPLTG